MIVSLNNKIWATPCLGISEKSPSSVNEDLKLYISQNSHSW